MNRCVINVSTKKYWKGQLRLLETLQGKTNADLLFYTNESQVGAKPHSKSMYGFKPKAFEKAYEIGYKSVLWLDASMYVIKDLTLIFEEIESEGYYFQDSGWSNGRWTTPEQKEYFGTDNGTMISSGVLGLKLDDRHGFEFYKQWLQASEDGMFNGSHDVTRHDQTAASLIIEQMGLYITDNNTHWQYGNPQEQPLHKNILILANGIS